MLLGNSKYLDERNFSREYSDPNMEGSLHYYKEYKSFIQNYLRKEESSSGDKNDVLNKSQNTSNLFSLSGGFKGEKKPATKPKKNFEENSNSSSSYFQKKNDAKALPQTIKYQNFLKPENENSDEEKFNDLEMIEGELYDDNFSDNQNNIPESSVKKRIYSENERLGENLGIEEWDKRTISDKNHLLDIKSSSKRRTDEEITNRSEFQGVIHASDYALDPEQLTELREAAANLIQKVWRGFSTRKGLERLLLMDTSIQEEDEDLRPDQYEEEELEDALEERELQYKYEVKPRREHADKDNLNISAKKVRDSDIEEEERRFRDKLNMRASKDNSTNREGVSSSAKKKNSPVDITKYLEGKVGFDVDFNGDKNFLDMMDLDEKDEKISDSRLLLGYNTFKEINNNSKSLITVVDFGNSEFENSKFTNNKTNIDRARRSTEFIREQLKEDLFSPESNQPKKPSEDFINFKNSQSVANLEDIINQLNALQNGQPDLKEETLLMITKLKEDLKSSLNQTKGENSFKKKENDAKNATSEYQNSTLGTTNTTTMVREKAEKSVCTDLIEEPERTKKHELENEFSLSKKYEEEDGKFIKKVHKSPSEGNPLELDSINFNTKIFKISDLFMKEYLNKDLCSNSYPNLGSVLKKDSGTVSIFEKEPFYEFTSRKFQNIFKSDNVSELVKMREEIIEIRHKAHQEKIDSMVQRNLYSPRTVQSKKLELEKWVEKERKAVKRAKKEIQRGLLKTADTILRTKRDMMFMAKIMVRNPQPGDSMMAKSCFSEEDIVNQYEKYRINSERSQSEMESSQKSIVEIFSPRLPLDWLKNIKDESKKKVLSTSFLESFAEKSKTLTRMKDDSVSPIRQQQKHADQRSASDDFRTDDLENDSIGSILKDSNILKKKMKEFDLDSRDFENEEDFISNNRAAEESRNQISQLSYAQDSQCKGGIGVGTEGKKTNNSKASFSKQETSPPSFKISSEDDRETRNQGHLDSLASPFIQDISASHFVNPNNQTAISNKNTIKLFDENDELSESYLFEKKQDGTITKLEGKAHNQSESYSKQSLKSKSYNLTENHSELVSFSDQEDDEASIKQLSKSSPIRGKTGSSEVSIQDFLGKDNEKSEVTEVELGTELKDVIHDYLRQNKVITTTELEDERSKIFGMPMDLSKSGEFLLNEGSILNSVSQMISGELIDEFLKEIEEKGFITFINNLGKFSKEKKSKKIKRNVEAHFPSHETNDLDSPNLIAIQQNLSSNETENQSSTYTGVKTSLCAIREFVEQLIDLVKETCLEEYQDKINESVGLNPSEKLHHISQYELPQYRSEISDTIYQEALKYKIDQVLPFSLFELQLAYRQEYHSKGANNVIAEFGLDRLHKQLIFDSYNECLDFFRPFGKSGPPSPWRVKPSKTQQHLMKKNEGTIVLEKAKTRILEFSSNLCGLIPDKEDSPFGQGFPIDEEYLNQIREDRMVKMLSQEVVEFELDWINYEDEETEVQIEISNIIFEGLIDDIAVELFNKMSRFKITN